MKPALHPRLHARLQNREPGLIKLPIPLPSVPLLSPVVTPLVGGSNSQSSSPAHQPASQPAPLPVPQPLPLPAPQPVPQPAPAPPPASSPAPPQQPPASSSPPASDPGGGNGSGPPPSTGGSQGNPGNGKGDPFGSGIPPSGSPSPGSGSSSSSSPGSPPEAQPSPGSSSSFSSGTSPGSPSGGSLPLGTGTAARVAASGVAALPLNNEAAAPTSASGSPLSNSVQGVVGASSGVNKGLAPSITSGGSLSSPDSSQGSIGGPSSGNGSGNGAGSGSSGVDSLSSSSHSHLSSGAIGAIAIVIILCGLSAFYVLRKRYLRRKADRQVQWINGYITGENPEMQEAQRCTSMRSSWGTPIEHRFSDPFQMSVENSAPNTHEGVYNAEAPYPYVYSGVAPVLPMPVHSPIESRSLHSENPFADGNATPHPIRPISSLPIRISLISDGSGSPDPFDDSQAYAYVIDDQNPELGVDSGSVVNRDPNRGTQANFPMPPPTSRSSVSTVFAIGSPSQLLEPPPDILITFPDSPVSPTFAASGTSSYPRRASVKLPFQPSEDRRDEVHVEKGDQVNVVSVYEDGWAFVQNEKNKERGLIPLDRLEMDSP